MLEGSPFESSKPIKHDLSCFNTDKIVDKNYPFDSKEPVSYDLSIFNSNHKIEDERAFKNSQIRCRKVCDKKMTVEQRMLEAITFYRDSRSSEEDDISLLLQE